MPAGAILTPGSLTQPETEKARGPWWLLSQPWRETHSGPWRRMSGTQASVSTLRLSAGRPKSPTSAMEGRRCRGGPRLPSHDSIIAGSSPQM